MSQLVPFYKNENKTIKYNNKMNTKIQTIVDLDDPRVIEERNNRKLTADKIRQILSIVKNNPSSSAKRWVWELMQNAKDVPSEKFGGISIQIELDEDTFKFKHNGDPFRLKDIFSLIQQVSSKDSTNQDEKVTGKFGTGFISTHLLSDIISVDGYVFHMGEYRKFNTVLDREGDTSEILLPKIEKALDKIRNIDDNTLFPIDYSYGNNRTEDSFDTCFTYYLTSPEKKKAAVNGIEDLVNTLPVTMVNIPSIKHVEVINKVVNKSDNYTCSINNVNDNINKVSVSVNGVENNSYSFISYSNDNLALTVQVDNFESMSIIEYRGSVPYLYRDFPLIGSEKFYFPFLINGKRFNPTEDRGAILLHALESSDAIENRKIVDDVFKVAEKSTSSEKS